MGSKVVTVLMLSAVNLFHFTDSCTYDVLEGSDVNITLDYTKWSKTGITDLTWKKDQTIVYSAKNNVNTVNALNGTLVLKDVKLENAGTYSFEIYDKSGIMEKSGTSKLCVYARFSKPNLTYTCQEEDITLKCDVPGGKGLTFSWTKNGKPISEQKSSLSIKVEEEGMKYKCTAKNPALSISTDEVYVSCSGDLLFGFDRLYMIAILAGGGFLVLLLIIILIICCVTSHKQQAKHRREEEELRLLHLQSAPVNDQKKTKQSARGQPAPPTPQEHVLPPQMDEHSVQPQTRSRPPPPPMEDDDEPPPLPQPRRKPHGKKNSEPIPYI